MRQDIIQEKLETDLSILRTVVIGVLQTAAIVHRKFAKRMLCLGCKIVRLEKKNEQFTKGS